MRASRPELLLHGTTLQRARAIQASGRFAVQDTFFALGISNRAVARLFARRAAARRPGEGGPALVLVTLPQATLANLRANRLAIPRMLQDPPDVRGRVEWLVRAGGVELLNRDFDDLRVVTLRGRPPIVSRTKREAETFAVHRVVALPVPAGSRPRFRIGGQLSPAGARGRARRLPGIFIRGARAQAAQVGRAVAARTGGILTGPERHGNGLSHYHVILPGGERIHIWFHQALPRGEFFT